VLRCRRKEVQGVCAISGPYLALGPKETSDGGLPKLWSSADGVDFAIEVESEFGSRRAMIQCSSGQLPICTVLKHCSGSSYALGGVIIASRAQIAFFQIDELHACDLAETASRAITTTMNLENGKDL
jgi:hypothetical protein